MLASMTPDGKRKLPFETESTNYEQSDQLLHVRLSLTDGDLMAPSSKRPRQIEMHNSQESMAVQEQENTGTEMEIVYSEEITRTNNKLSLHESSQNINHKQFLNMNNNGNVCNNYEMVAQNLCTRCQAGESGHIKHIFH